MYSLSTKVENEMLEDGKFNWIHAVVDALCWSYSFSSCTATNSKHFHQLCFISIDCGGPENFEYTDDTTEIKYSTDGAYIQTGVNKNISSEYAYPKNSNLPLPLSDLRSFPQGMRNCYRLLAGRKGSLHLIRASFLYGNYDGKNKLPEFDLYVGVNFWSSVKFRNASEEVTMEIISRAQSEVTNVCLVNKGAGTPFISALELRPLNSSIYNTEFGESASLLLFKRWDIAALNLSGRYEDDIYDRIWTPYNSSSWDSISNSSTINVDGDGYKAPIEVISSAARPRNNSGTLEFSWTPDDPNWKFYVYMYFAEVERLQKTQLRKFNISWNGSPLIESFVPRYSYATTLSNSKSLVANEHRISIHKTKDSTLPPILNAVEIFVVRQLDALPTFGHDVDAMMDIKDSYKVERNWVGDPCEPKNYTWEGLNCNYSTSFPPRIISLNLSSSSLSGIITPAISNLSSLESLDLSDNSLTGPVPQFLEALISLKYLNLQGNQLSGYVSDTLLERSKAGLLTLRVDDQNLCDSDTNEEMSSKINKVRTVSSKNWQYTYAEVLDITSNFEMVIGKGGFGTVYRGHMNDGNEVAVKMLSPSSAQGPKEFQTEAELLMTVHHKIWYPSLVIVMKITRWHSYMNKKSHCLSWERRIQIAIDAAEEAKIADFGLSKAFKNDNQNAESAVIHDDDKKPKSTFMGTTGYLDPEYYKLRNLNEKSDIYSFGIVLLELITGRPAVLKGNPSIHILEWLRPELERGDLNRILDPMLEGQFDGRSGWKALGIAMSCTASPSIQRPTMSVVLAELKQCFKMESPSDREIFVAPKQFYSEFCSSSEAYSMDSESITYPYPR
ncbi:Serine-threonine/tyrosine-protein kinase, catalytic domain [Sesbania bispinosa]|nr:Serine-threonine/tyrosine-protein kinase, catalytic domain [Sesbania bispinosa]